MGVPADTTSLAYWFEALCLDKKEALPHLYVHAAFKKRWVLVGDQKGKFNPGVLSDYLGCSGETRGVDRARLTLHQVPSFVQYSQSQTHSHVPETELGSQNRTSCPDL